MLYGYYVLCSNAVAYRSRERLRTILAVTRTITSAADGLSGGQAGRNRLCIPVSNGEDIKAKARPLFFGSLGVSLVAAFMQWTGSLGKLPTSPVLESIMEIFYVQLESSQDMLNPDMFQQGDRPRCYEISKARGVAMSLQIAGIEETIEAGRRGLAQNEAVQAVMLRLMTESCSVHMASWIMADTLEHMFRTDLMIVMQMLGTVMNVPQNNLNLEV